MNKKLLYLAGGLAAFALVAFLGVMFFLGSVVRAGVNRFAPQITQTSVQLAGASISPLSGAGTLTGLTVGNPKGWTSDKAFYLGKIHVEMEPFSIFRDCIVIDQIVIEQPEFFYETHVISNNIGDLLKNIEASTGGGKGADPTAKSGQPIKMIVKKLVLKDARVTVGLGPAAVTMPMPGLELIDIGTKEGGITPAALGFAVMRSVTPNVIAASTQALLKLGGNTGAAGAEAVKQAGEAIKGLFGGSKK